MCVDNILPDRRKVAVVDGVVEDRRVSKCAGIGGGRPWFVDGIPSSKSFESPKGSSFVRKRHGNRNAVDWHLTRAVANEPPWDLDRRCQEAFRRVDGLRSNSHSLVRGAAHPASGSRPANLEAFRRDSHRADKRTDGADLSPDSWPISDASRQRLTRLGNCERDPASTLRCGMGFPQSRYDVGTTRLHTKSSI